MSTSVPTKTLVRSGLLAGAAALSMALPASLASAAPVKVLYQITGSGNATQLVFWDETGQKQTLTDVPLPWSKTVSVDQNLQIQLSVRVLDGDVSCKIWLDGKAAVEQKAKYSATCATDVRGAF